MFRSSGKMTVLLTRIATLVRPKRSASNSNATDQATVAAAIRLRADDGETTSLRQLHKITDLSQTNALKAVYQLERHNKLVIEQNLHDELESTVFLNGTVRADLDKAEKRGVG